MIHIIKFRANDLHPSKGKQIEFNKKIANELFKFTESHHSVTFICLSLTAPDIREQITAEFSLSPARGDYKIYQNQDGSPDLKDFFLKTLQLSLEANQDDFFAIKQIDPKKFELLYIPNEYSSLIDFLKGISDEPVVIVDEHDNHSTANNDKYFKQQIFYGAPGTGKSQTIDDVTDPNRTTRTTFHPDSDYASFVGAYKPTMERLPINAFDGTRVTEAQGVNGHDGKEEKIVYKFVPQAFMKAYVAAWSDLTKPYYLVIEEINRGNCAQIFGDLFQLLDRNNMGCSSYAIDADADITQFLSTDKRGFAALTDYQKATISAFVLIKDNGKQLSIGEDILNGKKLLLPSNLYIWATMNTSDQSLFPIDSAFKRRWNWEYVPIEYNKKNWTFITSSHRYSWGDFLQKMNPIIYDLTGSSDKQMGYFFAKPDMKSDDSLLENDIISEDVFLNKVLFYIWTDVLKDFDAGREPFVKLGTKDTYQFREFFENKDYLQEFILQLKLEEITVSSSPAIMATDESNDSLTEQQNEGKYELDGKPCGGIGELVRSIVEVLARKLTFEELHENFRFKTLNGKSGIEKGTASEQNEPGKKQRWYADSYTSSDSIIFSLMNEWRDSDYAKIASLVEKYGVYFPKGVNKR
jgi:hypothetical protein